MILADLKAPRCRFYPLQTYSPVSRHLSCYCHPQLHLMSSQEQMCPLYDDWKGVTDPALRKKLQNKLNQRAVRVRKREQKTLSILQQQSKNDTRKAGLSRRYALILPRPRPDQGTDGPLSQPRTLSQAVAMMACFDIAAYERYYAADPCLDHLLTLTKFNVLRAVLGNLTALGLSIQEIDDGDAALSPFNTTKIPISRHRDHHCEKSILPASLQPTTTQPSVPHHPWLDCFPYSRMRDNLVNALAGVDDCELCTDIMDPANGDVGLMVWGDGVGMVCTEVVLGHRRVLGYFSA